MIKSEHQIY